jgi:hypothetical protein
MGSKLPHLPEIRDAYTPVIQTNLVASYSYAGIIDGCTSDKSITLTQL